MPAESNGEFCLVGPIENQPWQDTRQRLPVQPFGSAASRHQSLRGGNGELDKFFVEERVSQLKA
jgi:hypothetical protein